MSNENKQIAQMALDAFGGKPKVTRYWDESEASKVDVLVCVDRPQIGVSSYSTIGLSDVAMFESEKQVGVELVGACESSVTEFANIISTAAFCIINSSWSCSPGRVFPDIVGMYECSTTMRHLLFVTPFLWGDELQTLDLPSKTVAWLMTVPISEEEYKFAESFGSEKLEELFDQNQIDVFDINRTSVI